MVLYSYHLQGQSDIKEGKIRQLIRRRRRQLLVHSYIYYQTGSQLVSDAQWDKWAKHLVRLQAKYPDISATVDYAKEFKDFDGSSGYQLPYNEPEIRAVAERLLNVTNH